MIILNQVIFHILKFSIIENFKAFSNRKLRKILKIYPEILKIFEVKWWNIFENIS